MRFTRTTLAVSVSMALTACGGGGGGGAFNTGSGSNNSYSTFTRVGTVKPLSGTAAPAIESALYSYNIDSTGGDELILTGRMNPAGASAATWQDFNISIWGWSGGSLVDKSTQWFGTLNRAVVGTEEQVKFGDFDGDGHRDMYAGPYTDDITLRGGYELANTGAVFFNSGSSSFNHRTDIILEANTHAHASAIADLNSDGRDDIWSTAGATSTVLLGNADRSFTRLSVAGNPQAGGSGIAIADFTAVGTKSVMLTDQGSAKATTGSINNLYTYSIDLANSRVDLTHFSALPTPRFELPKWSGAGFTGGHEVRVLADIQLTTGKTASSQGVVSDAVIFSRANQYDVGHANAGSWPELSEVQFLLNGGAGTFTDITDTVLKGYDTSTVASYNAVFRDINGDGRLDIVIPGNSWTSHSGSQVLMWQSATNAYGFEYQSSYAVVMKAFQDGAKSLESNASFGATGIAVIEDATGNLYIATAVSTSPDGTAQSTHRTIYITPLNGLTFNQTRSVIQANWPWLSSAQIDSIMSQSTRTYLGLNLLDTSAALSPIGKLTVPTANGFKPATGSISGLNLGAWASDLRVQDSTGRSFAMDYSPTKIDMINAWSSRINDTDDTKSMALTNNLRYDQYGSFRYGASSDNTNQVLGMPDINLTSDLRTAWQFTRLPYSPWISMSGSWGSVKSSSTVEGIIKWKQQQWTLKSGVMHTMTEIDPGLVTHVNPITAVWADASYHHQGWSMGAGLLPKIIKGSADLSLPTGVDSGGRIQYTRITAGFDNPAVGFARIGYKNPITKRIMLDAAAMSSTDNRYSFKMEIKSQW